MSTENLSVKQQEILQQFRSRVGNNIPLHLSSDFELSKWLIARNFNIDKAEAILLKSLEWRKELQMDKILEWEAPEVLQKYYPLGLAGFDKEGCPVVINSFGNMDIRGLMASCSNEDIMRYAFQVFEKSLNLMRDDLSRYRLQPIGKMVFIVDCENFSLRDLTWTPGLNLILKLTQMFTENFPEIVKIGFGVNAPRIYTIALNLLKPFLDVNTLKKFRFYGKTGWKEELLREIDADQLPVHLGGTMTDPDGNTQSVSKISVGGKVPERFYLKNKIVQQENDDFSQSFENNFNLSQDESKTFEFQIDENVGAVLRWEFMSGDGDITYKVSRLITKEDKNDDDEVEEEGEEELIPMSSVNCKEINEEGSIICDERGLYKIIFKNENRLKSIEVFHNIELQPPEKREA